MAEILVMAQDAPVPDHWAKWYAGMIVTVEDDGWQWGTKEVWPKFGIVKVPGLSKESAVQYMDEWRTIVDFSIMSHNEPSDSYRVRATNESMSVSGKGAFTRAGIEGFLDKWGATVVNFNTSQVTFDISVYDAITSNGFWNADVSGVVFVETSYDKTSGDHIVQVQSSPFSNDDMRIAVEENGGIVIPPDSFAMNRSTARQKFLDDVEYQLSRIFHARRRWYVTASGMTALATSGGVITITPTQLLNNIADALLD